MAEHEFTYANLGHGDKDLFVSACACGATRILRRTTGNRWEWMVVEQVGTLPACTCPTDEDEETMHPIEGFHAASTHSLECPTDDKE